MHQQGQHDVAQQLLSNIDEFVTDNSMAIDDISHRETLGRPESIVDNLAYGRGRVRQ